MNHPPARDTDNRPPWLDERLYPFVSHVIEVEGCQVHYVDEGRGPVVLLLHGNPTWSFLYRDIILGLRGRYRCVALDLPGFGRSRARAGYGFTMVEHAAIVEQAVLALDLQDMTLMGQDWGGPIGLAVASRHPHRCARLVLGNTFGWPIDGVPRLMAFSWLLGGPLGAAFLQRGPGLIALILALGCRRRRLAPAILAAYQGPFMAPAARQPIRVAARQLREARAFLREVEAGLAQLRHLPVLLVWGTRDPAFRSAQRRRFERAFPRHETVLLPGAGHFIQEDAGPAIAASIARFAGAKPNHDAGIHSLGATANARLP